MGRPPKYEMASDGTKKCVCCNVAKPVLTDFYSETYKNGNVYYKSACKTCAKASAKVVTQSLCSETRKQYRRNWLEKNPNAERDAQRRHLEKTDRRKMKKYWASDKGRAMWFKGNQLARGRAAGVITEGSRLVTLEWFRDLQKRQNFRCYYCQSMPDSLAVDHVVPTSRGGLHECSNIVAACISCNSSKNDKLLSEWGRPELAIPMYGLDLATA